MNDLNFWKQVQKEFIKSENRWFCTNSRLFQDKWQSDKFKIVELAKEFNKSLGVFYNAFDTGRSILFYAGGNEIPSGVTSRLHRIMFLEWVINRLENENKDA